MIKLIEAKNIMKSFNNHNIIKGIDFEIYEGEILALIGENGAGKSTTISMLLGIEKADSGEIIYWRDDFTSHIGVQLQSTPFFEGYTTEENLKLFAALYNIKLTKNQVGEKLKECNLLDARKTPAIKLSGGQQKRLAIAVTTLHNPKLVILDEPAAGLDPRARQEIRNMIQKLSNKGVAIVFSSHDMEEVSHIANRIIFIHNGKVIEKGNPKDLLEKYNLSNLDDLYLKLTDNKEEL